MVSAAPGATFQGEAEHVRRAVFKARMRDDPSPLVYVENVFSPATYAQILHHFPADTAFRPWEATGLAGNYQLRHEISVRRESDRLPPDQRAFWCGVADLLEGPVFRGLLFERFAGYARGRFGERALDPSFLDERIRTTFILNRHEAGYYLGPHTDRAERVFTCIFYLPERDGLDRLGTTLYRPREPGFRCSGAVHHDPTGFEPRETFPYRPNSVLIFAKSDVIFHGVGALTAEQLQGSLRRGMQVTFFVHNERARDACTTALSAAVPARMRVGTEHLVPIRLRNLASSELAASYPYMTQLGYRWFDEAGRVVELESGVRTPLPRALAPGDAADGSVRVVAPRAAGRYVLRLTVVQEGVAWFEDIDRSNGMAAQVDVTA